VSSAGRLGGPRDLERKSVENAGHAAAFLARSRS